LADRGELESSEAQLRRTVVDAGGQSSPRYGSEGWGFESLRARHPPAPLTRNSPQSGYLDQRHGQSADSQLDSHPPATASRCVARLFGFQRRDELRERSCRNPASATDLHRPELPGCHQLIQLAPAEPKRHRCLLERQEKARTASRRQALLPATAQSVITDIARARRRQPSSRPEVPPLLRRSWAARPCCSYGQSRSNR
jgi:hypothetical protein